MYDKDGSGEIDPEEMQEIFTKLCSLVTAERKMEEKAREREEEAKRKFLLTAKLKLQEEDTGNFKLMSSRLINRTKRVEKKKKTREPKNQQKSPNLLSLSLRDDDLSSNHGSDCSSSSLEQTASARSGRTSLDSGVSLECPSLSLAWELRDPDRQGVNSLLKMRKKAVIFRKKEYLTFGILRFVRQLHKYFQFFSYFDLFSSTGTQPCSTLWREPGTCSRP